MPGVAEHNIAIDVISSTSSLPDSASAQLQFSSPRPRLAGRVLRLIGLDAVVTAGSAVLCSALFAPTSLAVPASLVFPTACLSICVAISFFERGLYAAPEIVSRKFSWRKLSVAWLQAVAVGTTAVLCLDAVSGKLLQTASIPPGLWLPAFLFVGFAAIGLARTVRGAFHAGSEALNRTVIVGGEEQVHELLVRIRIGSSRTFNVVGIVEPVSNLITEAAISGVPFLGDVDALERMIRQDGVDSVLVAMPWSEGEKMRAIIDRISMAPVDVYIYPGMNGLVPLPRQKGTVADLPLLIASTRPIGGWRALIKRAEDVALSVGILIFISPVMLTIAAAIKLTSKGPVFFRQRRLGYNNRVIEVLKFRSMYTHLADADATLQAFRGDKRVTRVGAWLRKTSLDELPQLLNVLRGEMSLVGPRPHALATTAGGLALEEAVPVYPSRHRVKPGITGWAQVNGYRGALDTVDKIVHRVNHDLYYIENWSLSFDLKILWRTARLVFADDNAF